MSLISQNWGHGFAELAKVIKVMVILVIDKECIIVLEILLLCLTRRLVSATEYEVYGFLSIIEVLLFQFV